MTPNHLTIGEFARRTGLSLKALRLYDESGLLVPAAVDEVTGYRYYAPAQETAARRISLLRRLDMPLARIAALLATTDTTAATEALLGWWEEQEHALAQRRGTVECLVSEWREGPREQFSVCTRDVPDRLLATITSNVLQAGLVPALTDGVTTSPAVPDAVARQARHSRYSDPGAHAGLLRAVDPATPAVAAVARNLIAHYRGEAHLLPARTRDDVDLRWLADQLATDQERHGVALAEPRPLPERLQGCCRDHSLFSVGVLREHGVPARTRIGFASYFNPSFHHDHVVVERFDGGRWARFDSELGDGFTEEFDVTNMPTGTGSPFETAAEVWLAHRSGALDAQTYGVDPSLPLKGPRFVAGYVIFEVAHRHGDELLLWDVWGAMADDADLDASADLIDRVATLLVAADAQERAGDLAGPAAAELAALYAADDRLHPGEEVGTLTPLVPDAPPRRVRLR